jgi:5-methyltetrahydrofolate--homocysteine methyltransferase
MLQMLIVGEKINPIRKDVAKALAERDEKFIQDMVLRQVESSIDFLDLNAGNDPYLEAENLKWLVEVVQDIVNIPLSIDSASPDAIVEAFMAIKNKENVMVNSITAQYERNKPLLKIIKDYNCKVIGLCMGETGVPKTSEGRVEMGKRVVDIVDKHGIPYENLFLDLVAEPISVDHTNGRVALKALELIKSSLPGIKTIVCVDAISFGLPKRRLLHRAFLPLLMAAKLDAIFCDPLDASLMAIMKTVEALLGHPNHNSENYDH